MITFAKDGRRFNYRVAGIAIDENQILLHQAEGSNFWTCPGGHTELGEPSKQTLQREMKEELETEIEIVRLLWVIENFFVLDRQEYHELGFYYLMQFPQDSLFLKKGRIYERKDEDINLIFRWFTCDQKLLATLPLLPSFLQNKVNNLPHEIQYLTWDERRNKNNYFYR